MHAAVFVDFDNLFASIQAVAERLGLRPRELSLQALEALKVRLEAEGAPMVLGRSYAAFDVGPGLEVAHDLALHGFDPQYVLVNHQGGSSADVQLTVDVCRVLYRRPDIDTVVIVSGERDFIPLARQVLEEGKGLRMVAVTENACGDLRMRVGGDRFWNLMDLLTDAGRAGAGEAVDAAEAAAPTGSPPEPEAPHGVAAGEETTAAEPVVPGEPEPRPVRSARPGRSARVVGRIPVTWERADVSEAEMERRLATCLDLVVRARIRHGSREVWLSPFLKGPMSQHFSSLVHPERRALINELRARGAIRVEERDNLYADHPYSVIVLQEEHPLTRAALERTAQRADGGA